MSQRAEFQIQVLERLGVPLLTSVGSVAARSGAAPDVRADAARIAELIARTVQMSVSLSDALEIRDDRGQADGLRLALAGLSAPLVAGAYEMAGRVPGENDISRMADTLGAVLAFADNFTPAADTTARLAGLEPGAALAAGVQDEPQIHVQALFALVPVVQAVGVYSFGRPEKKLVQDIANQLMERAAVLGQSMMGPDASLSQRKRGELAIVRALGLLYAQTHAMETSRLMMMDDTARTALTQNNGGQVPMDSVWLAFDRAVEMLRLAAQAIAPDVSSDVSSAGASSAPAASFSRAPSPMAQQPAPQRQNAPQGAGPMSFFGAPKQVDGQDADDDARE